MYCVFCPKRQLLLQTNYEIRGLVVSKKGANIHSSVPTSLQDPAINLYTSVVVFLVFCRLVEPGLNPPALLPLRQETVPGPKLTWTQLLFNDQHLKVPAIIVGAGWSGGKTSAW